jgi:hypothetical protein
MKRYLIAAEGGKLPKDLRMPITDAKVELVKPTLTRETCRALAGGCCAGQRRFSEATSFGGADVGAAKLNEAPARRHGFGHDVFTARAADEHVVGPPRPVTVVPSRSRARSSSDRNRTRPAPSRARTTRSAR